MTVVVQMHGEPGSGKTTVARAIAPRIPAVHLDKDVLMSAIVRTRIPAEVAGPASYEVTWDLAESLLQQGHSVVVDCPAYWPVIEERGRGLARNHGAHYFMIETRCDDRSEIERRLATREALLTNPRERIDWLSIPGTREPSRARLTLDTSQPLGALIESALAYLAPGRAA
jgi:predicted kinase